MRIARERDFTVFFSSFWNLEVKQNVKSYKEKKRDFGKLGRNGTIVGEETEEAILRLGFPSPLRTMLPICPASDGLLGWIPVARCEHFCLELFYGDWHGT
jgi:hypothetical protein